MPLFDQDPEPNPTSDRCVLVIAGGTESDEQLALMRPRMEAYAQRCGADFVTLHGDQSPNMPVYNKFRAHPFLAAYRQTLYLDTDILINDHAPSIFDAYPDAEFAAANEWETVTRNLTLEEFAAESNTISDAAGLPRTAPEYMPNAGVVLFTPQTADCWKPPVGVVPRIWLYDQHCLTSSLQRAGTDIRWLGSLWHHSFLAPNFWDVDAMRDAYFVHLNGARPHSYRIELMRRLLAGNVERLNPPKGGSDYAPWLDTQ